MKGGKLRHFVEIERQVQVGTTQIGAPSFVWHPWRGFFAGLEVIRGREHWDGAAKQRYSEEVYKFTTRWVEVAGIDSTMRLVFEGQPFDIKSIRPDVQKRSDCIIEATLQDGSVGGITPLLVFLLTTPPSGVVGVEYPDLTLQAKGGTPPYQFGVGSGALPLGLVLDTETGTISGTPTQSGSFDIAFSVTDAEDENADMPAVNITVSEA